MALYNLMDFALPFLFVLAIVYGALEMGSPIKNKAVRTIISLVISFVAVSTQGVVDLINQMIPYAAIMFIIVFFFGFVRKSIEGKQKDYTLIIIVAGLVLIFLASQGIETLNALLPYTFPLDTENFLTIIGIVLIIAIIYAAYLKHGEK